MTEEALTAHCCATIFNSYITIFNPVPCINALSKGAIQDDLPNSSVTEVLIKFNKDRANCWSRVFSVT